MRRTTAGFGLVLGLIASLATVSWAQPPQDVGRPQAKIMNFAPLQGTSAAVGVLGQVRQPGTYQFAAAPTLNLVIATAEGLRPNASPMIRIVRGRRVAQSVAYPAAGEETLQSGDLVIVDERPTRSAGSRQPEKKFVWLALVGLTDRPFIVPVEIAHARAELIVQKLGQPAELLPSVRILHPPTRSFPGAAGASLADGAVLLFDRSQIRVKDLPDDLPPILPCGLPEPEIGAYNVRNAYEERLRIESSPPRRSSFPHSSDIPLPTPDQTSSPEPTPIPLPEEPPATISSAKQSSGTPTISTVPFSNGSAPIAARRNRLTGLAPSPTSSAADAQPPAWRKIPVSASSKTPDTEIDSDDSPKSAAGALSGWQMLAIVSSAGLLVALALAVRTLPRGSRRQTAAINYLRPRPTRPIPAASLAMLQAESKAVIPAPHLPAQSFTATTVRLDLPSALETLDQRQHRFAQILQHELPILEEPLALRPGIPIGSPAAPSTSRQHLDAPHPRLPSGPHLRIGPEAPVERALRQLQGGRS